MEGFASNQGYFMPGLTIDKFDVGIYIQYARRTQLIEQVRAQYHIPEAGQVPATALMVDLYPKLKELDILMGTISVGAPWAYFYAPAHFIELRRNPFAFHRIVPSMEERKKKDKEGNQEGEEEQSEDQILESIECITDEEVREKNVLKGCLKQIEEINSLLRYIGGRIGQFLQG